MEIRRPNEKELNTVLSLSPQAIFDGTLGEVKPTNKKVEQLVQPLLAKGSYYLIATENDRIMGWILIGESKDQFTDRKNGFIYELFVVEDFRGKGISKQLMNTAINHLKQTGYLEVRLSAFVENPAIQLYEKIGFSKRTVTMSLSLQDK